MKLNSLEELFLAEIGDLQDAEAQLIKALPEMAKASSAPELQQAFTDHLQETKHHAERLESIANRIGQKVPSKSCAAMKGLIKEGSEVIKASGDPAVKDAALIGAAQRVEHYEIAAYGCARTFAQMLEDSESVELLQSTLNEEAAADQKLNELAVHGINLEAART